MEYNDLQSFERLTGLALFQPQGESGFINLGNIEMLKIDYGTKSFDTLASVRGRLRLRRRHYYQTMPVYSIDGNQFVSPAIPLLLLGDRLADVEQAGAISATFTFTAVPGRVFLIGKYDLSNVVVQVGGITKTPELDYFLDDFNGLVSVPVSPVGIAEGDTVVVIFDCTGLILEDYAAFTRPDRLGQLVVFAEDSEGPPAKEIWVMTVSLSCKKGADMDPTKFRKFTLEAAVLGNADVRKRGSGFDSLGVGGDSFAWR